MDNDFENWVEASLPTGLGFTHGVKRMEWLDALCLFETSYIIFSSDKGWADGKRRMFGVEGLVEDNE